VLDALKRSVITTILTVLFTVLLGIIVARVLGPEQRGQLGYVMVAGSLIWSLCNFGLHDSYIYFKRSLNRKNGIRKLFFLVFSISLGISLLLSLIIYFYSNEKIFNNFTFIIFVNSYAFYYLSMHLLQLQEGLKKYNLVKVLLPLINLLILGLFFNYELDYKIVVYMYIVSYFIIGFYSFIYLFKNEYIDGDWIGYPGKKVFSYALKSYGVAIFGVIISNYDKFYFLLNDIPANFGVYIVAYSVSRNISLIPNTLATVLFANYAGRDEQQLAKAASNAYSLIFFPMIIMYVFIAILSIYLLPILFGIEYSGITLPFCILALEAIVSSLGWILAQRFMASGRPGLVLVRQLISLIPLVVISNLDLEYFSVPEKIALSMLIASIIRLLITMYIYKNTLFENVPKINFNLVFIYKEMKLGIKK
jgi:enterobacterial common antigen flippase